MRVGVIGGGAAGLCAARHASVLPGLQDLVLFEQADSVGGTWVYTETTGRDSWGLPVHSSMYRNMRTNLPKEVMGFPDFPFPSSSSPTSFISHSLVKQYLEEYTRHFSLRPYIKFGTFVRSLKQEGIGKWRIRYEEMRTKEISENVFDIVFVCNGHYSQPKSAQIPGQKQFKGLSIHSHQYREPVPFRGKRTLVLGAGPSGIDIAIELATECPQVHLCHKKKKINSFLPPNLIEHVTGIKEFVSEKEIELEDGTRVEVDAVVECTGYNYSFPFLQDQIPLTVSPYRVDPLYQHLLYIPDPSLVFPGICQTICPFPNFHVQITFALKLLMNESLMPSKTEMEEWLREEEKRRSLLPHRNFHYLANDQWDYLRQLSRLAQTPHPVPPVIQKLYDEIHKYKAENLVTYKNENFHLIDEENFHHEIPENRY